MPSLLLPLTDVDLIQFRRIGRAHRGVDLDYRGMEARFPGEAKRDFCDTQ
jgi:hypothetical protein